MTRLPNDNILDLLSSLVDKSLVVYEEHEGAGRYRLLETVRQYAQTRLTENGEAEAVQNRAASWFLALAEEAEPQLTGPEQAAWLQRLETEHDNFRASLTWYESLGEQQMESTEASLRLSGALTRFWMVRGYFFEGRQWLGRALASTQKGVSEGKTSPAQARALHGAGNLAAMQGDYTAARLLYEESLTIKRVLGDAPGIAYSLNNLGNVASSQDDYIAAQALYQESLSIRRQMRDQEGIAAALLGLGNVAYRQGDLALAKVLYEESLSIRRQFGNQESIATSLMNLGNTAKDQRDLALARVLYEESLSIRRQLGDQQGIATLLNNLGLVTYGQNEFSLARAMYEESLTIKRQLGDQMGIANSLGNLGNVALAENDYALARTFLTEVLTIMQRLGNRASIVASLAGMAGVAFGQNQSSRAARLLGAAASLRETIGSGLAAAEQKEFDKRATSVREALGEEAFAAARDAGRAMTLEQAVEFALAERINA